MTRIGFTGPYANVNFGDYAMLVNNIADLGVHELTVFSYDDGFLRRLMFDYCPALDPRIVAVELDQLPDGQGLTERPITGMEVLALLRNEDEVRTALELVDVLIVNGGGYLNELWARPHRQMRLLQILAPAMLAAEMGKRVVFSANGIGPFADSLDSMANLLAGLPTATLTVRDRLYSPMWARRLGVAEDRLRHAPDDLLLIHESLRSRAPRIADPPRRRYVVVETYQPVDQLRADLDRWRSFVERMADGHDCDVVFLPLHLGAGGVDQALLLHDELGLPWVDIREVGYLPIEDAVALVSGAELVISGRYHALVLALAARTPVLSVVREVAGDLGYYYSKNAGVLRAARPAGARELDYLVTSTSAAFAVAEASFDELRRAQLADAAAVTLEGHERLVGSRHDLILEILGDHA
ncbi:hypothetical protein DUHN55_21440 [Helicobacter pylori]